MPEGPGPTATARSPAPLMKLTTRCVTAVIDGLNEALLAAPVEGKVLLTDPYRTSARIDEADRLTCRDPHLEAVKVVAELFQAVAHPGRWCRARGSGHHDEPFGGVPGAFDLAEGPGHRVDVQLPGDGGGEDLGHRAGKLTGRRAADPLPGEGQGRAPQ